MKFDGIVHILNNRKTILGLNAFLTVCLILAILFFLRSALLLFQPVTDKGVRSGPQEDRISVRALQDYAGIFRNNPFGFPAGELKPISSVSGPVQSQSDVSLIGTVSGRSDLSYAIFSDKSGQQEVFRPGQQVFGLGKLMKVEKQKVFVTSQGTSVEIPLSDITSVTEISQGRSTSTSLGRRSGDSTFYLDQQRIQQALDKPAQIMTDARFIPNMVDGKQQGFVLAEVKNGGIYQSLGLQNGDVVLKINEYTIASPESALQAFTALRGLDRAELDILRSGSRMTLTYQIR